MKEKKKRFLFISVVFLWFLSFFSASGYAQDDISARLKAESDLPRTVAVLPFQNDTQDPDIAQQVRKAFYNHFSSKPYLDVELTVVDEKIVQLEKAAGKNILVHSPQEICSAVGCDGLVYGKVTDYTKVYAVLYSQIGVEAEAWIVNAKTGKEVFRVKDSVKYHGAGLPITPLGAIMSAVSAAINLRDIQQMRMVNELCYKLNEKILSPEGIIAEMRPVIKEVLTNVKEGPFGKGKVIRTGMEGDKGMIATFSIGNFKKGIPMQEKEPGVYTGEYYVLPGDNTKDMPLFVSLKKPAGLETEWIDVSGTVTIDTTPPSVVSGLRAKGFQGRVEVSWQGLKDVPDLKGYKVLRSEQPLSGYAEIANTEHSAVDDTQAQQDKVYYYRVTAYDKAGNESDPRDAVKASLAMAEAVTLTGAIQKDTTLSGLYNVKGDLVVPKGLSLAVEPGTVISFDEGAPLNVFGTLTINGKESPAELIPLTDKRWKGITVDGGTLALNGFRLRGADKALSVKNTDGMIENGIIAGHDLGLMISGTPSPTVTGVTISNNKTGVELVNTDAKIIMNNILLNGRGIVLKGFSGEIKDNNILSNTKNVLSDSPIKIGTNYFGSVYVEEMKLDDVRVEKVYDAKLPGGKIVDALSNKYATLTPEDRLKKSSELIAEAGNYFKQRNYGKASVLFEESLEASPSPESYYYLALCYQEMREEEKSIKFLKQGMAGFPKDVTLLKAYGMVLYQKGNEVEARKVFEEILRISPDDRQIKFLMEKIQENRK